MKKSLVIIFILILLSASVFSKKIPVSLTETLRIPNEGDNYFIYYINDFTVDDAGNIYVVDPKGFSIIKFDKTGTLLQKAGKQGEGPGEFVTSLEGIEFYNGDILVLANLQGVLKFNSQLSFDKKQLYYVYPFDFKIWKDKFFFLNELSSDDFNLDILKWDGTRINKLRVQKAYSTHYENHKSFDISDSGQFVFASKYEDKVEFWASEKKKLWSKHLFSGDKVKYKNMDGKKVLDWAESRWYQGVLFDNYNNILIQKESGAKKSISTLLVLSKQGDILKKIKLTGSVTGIKAVDSSDNIYIASIKDDPTGENDYIQEIIRYKIIYKEI